MHSLRPTIVTSLSSLSLSLPPCSSSSSPHHRPFVMIYILDQNVKSSNFYVGLTTLSSFIPFRASPQGCSLTSSLTHRLVFGSDIICNNLSPMFLLSYWFVFGSDTIYNNLSSLRVDIVFFELPFWTSREGFKMCRLRRGFHTLIRNVSLPFLTEWDLRVTSYDGLYLFHNSNNFLVSI